MAKRKHKKLACLSCWDLFKTGGDFQDAPLGMGMRTFTKSASIRFFSRCDRRQDYQSFTKLLSTTLCAIYVVCNLPSAVATEQKPNFVVIVADDLGYGDLGCYGSWIQTPNLDRLAREGMRFTDFHANGPVCSPTRCALLTGRYQQRAGIDGLVRVGGLKRGEVTFANALRPLGYTSALFGKWHLGSTTESNPIRHGFDEFRGFLGGRIDYFQHSNGGQPDWWDGVEPVVEKGYSTTLITDYAVDFIRRSKSKPFCLYVAYNAVHTPIQDPETGQHGKTADVFGKMVQAMDQAVGRIIAAVNEHGLAEKTFVFFFSDNGGPEGIAGSSNKPLRGFKGSLWEGGHRVPAIAWWPGRIPAGKVAGQPAMSMDLVPTMLELAGATLPDGHKLDGVSLVPVLLRKQSLSPRKLFWKKGRDFAMRDGPWKLLVENGTAQLFNLDEDLSEQHDLATAHPERVKTMLEDLQAWIKDVHGEEGERVLNKIGKNNEEK